MYNRILHKIAKNMHTLPETNIVPENCSWGSKNQSWWNYGTYWIYFWALWKTIIYIYIYIQWKWVVRSGMDSCQKKKPWPMSPLFFNFSFARGKLGASHWQSRSSDGWCFPGRIGFFVSMMPQNHWVWTGKWSSPPKKCPSHQWWPLFSPAFFS